MDHQRVVDRIDAWITGRPGAVIAVFLLLTVVFAAGLGNVETEGGRSQFVEDLSSFETLERVQEEFGGRFGREGTSTTLVQRAPNVLSRPALLRLLRTKERLADRPGLRVESTGGPAETVARRLDPGASTLAERIDAVEDATPGEIDAAVREAAARPGFETDLSDDFSRESASASGATARLSHGSDVEGRDERVRAVLATTAGDVHALGDAPDTIADSLILVLPAAFVLITLFLAYAYRDPVDLLLGIVAILMTLVWTFGLLGLAGVAFNPILVTVPPLLIAVGIDFGIHAINRYREERETGRGIAGAMRTATDQLLVAFLIVTGTTAIGFLSNLVSAFPPTRDFGVVAAAGIGFTFLVFGVFLPASKVAVDRLRRRYPIPTVSERPLGAEGSRLGRALRAGVPLARRAPVAVLVVTLVASGALGVYATGVDTGFSPDDFLPAEESPEALQSLPEPFRPPAEFEHVRVRNDLEANFRRDDTVIVHVSGPLRRPTALESLRRAGVSPPETVRRDGRVADVRGPVAAIEDRARSEPAFRRLVERNDADADGIPDRNLGRIYAALDNANGSSRGQFVADDRRSARLLYTVDGDADQEVVADDARALADRHRFEAAATGTPVIFDEAITLIFRSVIETLAITLVGVTVFLVLAYWMIEGRPSLGVANAVPVAVTVVLVVASMRALGIAFNAINGVLLSLTIGLGIDYSVHVVQRFADERRDRDFPAAIRRTVVGTGGALAGSVLTTVFGLGVLTLALNPVIGTFGLLAAMSVVYAFLVSLVLLPSVLAVWDRSVGDPTP